VEKEAQDVTCFYRSRFFETIKVELEGMEECIEAKRQKLSSDQIQVEFEDWVQDPMFSRTRDTKFSWIIETY
jgi:hypothetical protein